jgi:glutamine synthetase
VNWSIGNTTQGNLLDPGSTPHENIQFLLFCSAVIRGAHKYGPLLRAAIASAGNDHRLGANEAPPAIMSVYLGSQLEDVFEQISKGELKSSKDGGVMNVGLPSIPKFTKDAGDRNRTSPFAFTGNRFEFRAVGSNQSVAGPLIAMNTMLADSLNWIADQLEAKVSAGTELQEAILSTLKEVMDKHGNVVFGGDGYSSEWHSKAVEERGLKNIPNTADALPTFKAPEVIELFESTGVLSPVELQSRFEVYSEQYIMAITVEAKLMINMAKTMIYPAASRYLADLATTASALSEIGVDLGKEPALKIAEEIKGMMASVAELTDAIAKDDFASDEEHLQYCANTIRGLMDQTRTHADALEAEVADDLWPLPTYQEMLFIK